MLKNNANPNIPNCINGQALFCAAEVENPQIIELLLNYGAELNAQNCWGETALMYVAKTNPNPEVLRLLINAGADVNLKDENGETALFWAEENQNPEFEELLRNLEK